MPEHESSPVAFKGVTPILRVASIEASLAYFADALRFTVQWQHGDFGAVARGDASLMLCEGEQGHAGTWVYIGVSDADELRARSAIIRHPPTNYPWGSRELHVTDPDGPVLRFGSDLREGEPMGEWMDSKGGAGCRSRTAAGDASREMRFAFVALLALAVLSLRGVRWAYATFILLSLLYFPAKTGFRLNPTACQLALDLPLALFSLTNYAHVVLFALFFLMTSAQFRAFGAGVLAWAALATLAMGAAVEAAQGISGWGHCRLRDLVPDGAGVVLGRVIAALWAVARSRGAH
jgi:catechol 2,3-dioxygenase-like lactoylglutathione lyase family enzyme